MSAGATLPRATAIVALSFAVTACASLPEIPYINPAPPAAVANLVDASGRVAGRAVMIQDGNGVRILLDVNGLTPGAKAVHVHDVGQCTGPSFSSAGGHYNPTGAEHGAKNPRGPHAGDLPDVTVEASGLGHMEVTSRRLSLKKGSSMIDADGAALVVHEKADDERTDPDGGAGTRIACGVLIPSGRP